MLTFIFNVLGKVLGIGNLYCMPFYSAGFGTCATRNYQNQLQNVILANFECPLPLLIVEQAPTSGLRAQRYAQPLSSSIMVARLGSLHSATWNTLTGET